MGVGEGTRDKGDDAVLGAVRRALAATPAGSTVLAVSGGRDSMALLHAVHAAHVSDRVAAVATYNHRTGAAANHAAALVERVATRLGFRFVPGVAAHAMTGATEAEWRRARWLFLSAVASAHQARVATAHTRDDQLETVAFRAWRGAGPRGLAGLDHDDGPRRPLLSVSRADITTYVRQHDVPYVDDPDNTNRRHARTRWRLDLLPAMQAAHPSIGYDLLALGSRAAAWRRDVEALVADTVRCTAGPFGALLQAPDLAHVLPEHMAWLWPAMLAPFGVVPDHRALARLARGLPPGRSASLPKGAHVSCIAPGEWVVQPVPPAPPPPQRLDGGVRFGGWHFRLAHPEPANLRRGAEKGDAGPWHGRLPADIHLEVRAWRPGDRLAGPAGPRRVARWFSEAGIPGPLREGWPVVALGANVWWIPGVRQVELPPDAPTTTYVCDR
jgi:tRNA(Ile)-lysidine synthase